MTERERYLRTMRFEEVDHPPFWADWFVTTTLERWHREGLPEDVHIEDYFGFERIEHIPVNLGLVPPFKVETLEETEKYRIFRDVDGSIRKQFRDYSGFGRVPHQNQGGLGTVRGKAEPGLPMPVSSPEAVGGDEATLDAEGLSISRTRRELLRNIYICRITKGGESEQRGFGSRLYSPGHGIYPPRTPGGDARGVGTLFLDGCQLLDAGAGGGCGR